MKYWTNSSDHGGVVNRKAVFGHFQRVCSSCTPRFSLQKCWRFARSASPPQTPGRTNARRLPTYRQTRRRQTARSGAIHGPGGLILTPPHASHHAGQVNPFDQEFDPVFNHINSQSIVERMAKARWITGTAIVTKEGIESLQYTELGKEKWDQAIAVVKELFPDVVNAKDVASFIPSKPPLEGAATLFLMLAKLAPIIADLMPPPLTPGESQTLLGLFVAYARRRKAAGTSPPWLPPDRF
jgi:hypothetical protein